MKASVCFVLLFLAWPHHVRAQDPRLVVRDDFPGELSPDNWYVCVRPESEIWTEDWPGVRRAVRLVARPLATRLYGTRKIPADERHDSCRDARGKYNPDNAQRAEIWERVHLLQDVGTVTWIQFDFMVVLPDGVKVPRLVVGQLKAQNDSSPMLAQRFTDRHFMVTLSRENNDPKRKDVDCRFVVAHDELLPPPTPAKLERGCKAEILVDARERLPSPFGKWVRMTYRIKTGFDDGVVEVWADGKYIAKATGRIGVLAGKQYFKFGPYGNPVPYDLKAYLARYRRAPSCAELGEPSAAECQSK